MPSSTHILRVVYVVATLAIACGRYPVSTKADDRLPGVAANDDPQRTTDLPKHFILNPDGGRPSDYPAEISFKELETFLKPLRVAGQGCGGMPWEGGSCGMFGNTYNPTKTPWLNEQLEIDACYAQTKTGTFLASFMLGRNRYGRADRNGDKLTWEQNYQPEYEQQEIRQVLYGKDSAKRKKLLTRISDSLQNLDLSRFPAKRIDLLMLQVKRCENDSDPAVVTLARQLNNTLRSSGSQP